MLCLFNFTPYIFIYIFIVHSILSFGIIELWKTWIDVYRWHSLHLVMNGFVVRAIVASAYHTYATVPHKAHEYHTATCTPHVSLLCMRFTKQSLKIYAHLPYA